MTATIPRARYGGSKVKTGCITCKSRRVKCDETHPHCSRCTKGGRHCEGYAVPSGNSRHPPAGTFILVNYVLPLVNDPSMVPQLKTLEQRSLNFFNSRTATELAGGFAGDLWSRLLMQMAYHERAIRYAIVALGALHERFVNPHDFQDEVSQLALQQYGKAIQQVVKLDISRSIEAVDIALITCVLFSAFEGLQGHYKSALTHVISGVRLLNEQDATAEGRNGHYIPKAILKDVLTRLDTQAIEIGDASFKPPVGGFVLSQNSIPRLPDVFPTADEARVCLDACLNQIFHLNHVAQTISSDPKAPLEALRDLGHKFGMCDRYFEAWNIAFEKSSLPPTDQAVLILRMNQGLVKVFQKLDFSVGDMGWDVFLSEFDQIVSLAELFLQQSASTLPTTSQRQTSNRRSVVMSKVYPRDGEQGDDLTMGDSSTETDSPTSVSDTPHLSTFSTCSSTTNKNTQQSSAEMPLSTPPTTQTQQTDMLSPTFTLSLGIIPPLFVIVSRCRDPIVRRRALHILRTCNRKEGIWDSALAAAVGGRLMEIEEGRATKLHGQAAIPSDCSGSDENCSDDNDDDYDDNNDRTNAEYSASIPISTSTSTSTLTSPLTSMSTSISARVENKAGKFKVVHVQDIPEEARVRNLWTIFRSGKRGRIKYSISSAGSVYEEAIEW